MTETDGAVPAAPGVDPRRAAGVDRTPTPLHPDRSGRPVGRSSGAPGPAEPTAVADAHVPATASRAGRGAGSATLAAVGFLLTSRRTVDLCRVGSCLCPAV